MKNLIILLLSLISNNVLAIGEDLENCLTKNGIDLGQSFCETLRKEKAEDDAARQRQADWSSGANLETCHWNTGTAIDPNYCETMRKEKAKKDALQKEQDEYRAKVKREYDEEEAVLNKRRDDYLKEEAREEAALKRKCGKDYQTLRLGIAISRLQECSGATYVTKTVSAGGVIETYRTMFDFVDVKNGKVISFTKRRY